MSALVFVLVSILAPGGAWRSRAVGSTAPQQAYVSYVVIVSRKHNERQKIDVILCRSKF